MGRHGAVTDWIEVGERVWVRRYDPYDVNVTVVAGERSSVLVDTRTTLRESAEVREQLTELPAPPLGAVVITHAHLDHCLGAGTFRGLPVHASDGCRRALRTRGLVDRERWMEDASDEDRPHLAASPLVIPDTPVHGVAWLDLGGRRISLHVPGPGHTDHDLIVHVPDADVVCAGDLVEQGGPPQFDDGFPFAWPATLSHVQELGAATTVPGHGSPVGMTFVAGQRAALVQLAELCREVLAGRRTTSAALTASPFPEATTRTALARAAATS